MVDLQKYASFISIRDHCQRLPPKTTTHQVLALKLRRVFRIEVCSDNHHYTLAIKDYSINDLKQFQHRNTTQLTLTFSEPTIETPEKRVKYVQS